VRLAVAAGRPLSNERLLTDVWPDGDFNDGTVRVALSRLRAALPSGVIHRADGGYAVGSVRLDMRRFEDLLRVARDRSQTLEHRIDVYDEALGLWSGAAFESLERRPWIELEAFRLDELHEQAIDERHELQLITGHPAELIAGMFADHDRLPTRAHRAELLATALYRSGRQRDSLDVLNRIQRHLRDDLGLEPEPSLRALEQRILEHDEMLTVAPVSLQTSIAAEIESHIRSALTLTRAGAYDAALEVIVEATSVARRLGDRRSLALSLLGRARTVAFAGTEDPHPLIDEARDIARQLRDGQLLARSALARFGSGVPADMMGALVELTEPLELLPSTAPEQVDLLCAAAAIVSFLGSVDAAEQLVDLAADLHRRQHTIRSETVLLTSRSIVGALKGAPLEQVDAWATRAHELATEAGDADLVVISIQALLRSRYTMGDLAAVDAVLDQMERASRDAMLGFGVVRAWLCRSINAISRGELDRVPVLIEAARREGSRLRTFNATGATQVHQLLLDLELGQLEETAAAIRPLAELRPNSVWSAVLALGGDAAAARQLVDLAPDVPRDDLHSAFVALATLVAADEGDAALARWCASNLADHGDHTITVGLGTLVMNVAPYFAGLAHRTFGDLDGAAERLERALELVQRSDAPLWRDQIAVELADALARRGGEVARSRAHELLTSVAGGDPVVQSRRLARRLSEVASTIAGDDDLAGAG
jgi:DNA-binding SARP family transcriptional activator